MVRKHCLAVAASVAMVATGHAQSKVVPSWNTDVAPILARHCITCHRPGGSVSISFATYDEARPYADAIARRVWARTMPPWYVDPDYGKNFNYSNSRRPTDEELRTLIAWAKGGAALDDPAGASLTARRDIDGLWHLKLGPAGRTVFLEVEWRQDRYIARIGAALGQLHEVDSFTVENEVMVARDGAFTYRLTVDGERVTGTVTGPGTTEPVTGTKCCLSQLRRRTEGTEAPATQGARRENTGSM